MYKKITPSEIKARGTEQVNASIRKDFAARDKDIESLLEINAPADEPKEDDELRGI